MWYFHCWLDIRSTRVASAFLLLRSLVRNQRVFSIPPQKVHSTGHFWEMKSISILRNTMVVSWEGRTGESSREKHPADVGWEARASKALTSKGSISEKGPPTLLQNHWKITNSNMFGQPIIILCIHIPSLNCILSPSLVLCLASFLSCFFSCSLHRGLRWRRGEVSSLTGGVMALRHHSVRWSSSCN